MAKVVTKMVVGGSQSSRLEAYADEIPIDVMDDMLTTEADVIEPQIRENANTMLKGPYWTGTTALKLTRKPPHTWFGKLGTGQRQIALTFKGVRVRGNKKKTVTRNAEIAFLNEYGARNIPARPFIQQGIDTKEKEAFDKAEAVFDKWLDGENM